MPESSGILVSLCLLALLAGMINSVAGGGTLLTFPALVAALASQGMDNAEAAVVANATSTVALVPAALAGAWGYRGQLPQVRPWLLLLIGPSLIGGAIGALLVTRLPPEYFDRLVPWLLLLAAVLFLFDTISPKRSIADVEMAKIPAGWPAQVLLILFQFGVAIYGGYFGAGIGILMLSSLTMMRVGNIHEMNAVKTILAGCINGISVVVFAADGKVSWPHALPMAVAAVAGGYLGARLALRIKPRWVRWAVIVIGFALAAYFFVRL